MKPSEVGASYDEIAHRWNDDRFPRRNGIPQHERALAFLESRGHALDVGCGCNGRFIDFFLSHGFEVEGVDISTRMVDLARARHPDVTIHHADVCEWQLPRQYDFISAWDSIWHVPLDQQAKVLTKLLEGLSPEGVLVFTTGGVDRPSEKTDSPMGPRMYTAALGIPDTLEVIADAGAICRHLEYDQHPELHVYVIAQKRVYPS